MTPDMMVPNVCAAGAGVPDMFGPCSALSGGGHVDTSDVLSPEKCPVRCPIGQDRTGQDSKSAQRLLAYLRRRNA